MNNKDELIKDLKMTLKAEGFYVTGSYALSRMGFKVVANDIDIILYKPTVQTLDLLKELQKEYPAKTKAGEYNNLGLRSIFEKNEIKVDVFTVDSKPQHIELKEYNITTLCHIVGAKKRAGRPKDHVQLTKLSRSIYSPQEQNTYINNYQ